MQTSGSNIGMNQTGNLIYSHFKAIIFILPPVLTFNLELKRRFSINWHIKRRCKMVGVFLNMFLRKFPAFSVGHKTEENVFYAVI